VHYVNIVDLGLQSSPVN